ncbi:C39 family peptidase [Candidatus Uabimicrobium amorphum]|uniref:Peptidase C39-like domain-containing protein n=1 Tax=Uabimicrobium amorphum TaxID=2596890 RepID=A0A5S9IVX3_UABAM|nr:C39 family peptidase [Candidatus Uabimicrobium amorphum]BBM88070.1 hypothetical protein UABAM_06486 [Candidatus Uabimicrobium amorphum]
MKTYTTLLLLLALYCHAHAEYKSTLITDVPHIKQKPDFCGEACAAMYLQKLGTKIDQDDVFNLSTLDASLGRGCYTPELATSLKEMGFKVGRIWYKAQGPNFNIGIHQQWNKLYQDLLRGTPSIVCMHYSDEPHTTEHFRLVLGYDAKKDTVIYHEPAEKRGAYKRMKRSLFLKLWPLKYKKNYWTLIRMPLVIDSQNLPVKKATTHFTKADYAQHILQLKKDLPRGKFTILIEEPFVVIGDESPSKVKSRAKNTVRWAVNLLKKDYFTKDPDHIINIWLFKNRNSYMKNTYHLFGKRPGTPFGYYSYSDRALVMNISTGGGTLVHEIVHPFMHANFPDCPAWFNEGLASLFEQCGERNKRIVGFTNWRLRGLQIAITHNEVPSFKTLTGTTTYQFYNEDPGTNYSQARYLCYYLQQKGLLREFYQQFTKNHKKDVSGYATLQKVLEEKDMHKFKTKWQKFVQKLQY